MKPFLALLALIGAMLSPLADAQVPTSVNIRVLFTHTARASIGSGNLGTYAGNLTGGLDGALLFSNGDTRINSTTSYDSSNACCGGYNDFKDPTTVPTGNNAMTWASNDARIQEERDKAFGGAGADVIIIVADTLFGPDGGTLMTSCIPASQSAARRAIIGVNKNAAVSTVWELLKQFNKLNCGENANAQPYFFMQPGTSTTCSNFYTAGSTIPASQTVQIWMAATSSPGYNGYSNSSALAAANDAAAKCPTSNGMGVAYQCLSMACSPNGPNNAICTYNLRITYSAPNPPSVTNTNTGANATLTSQTCSNNFLLSAFSNPNKSYLGQPMGDATHNSVGGQNARLPVTNSLRNIKTAPPLKVGSGIIDFSR